MSTTQIANKIYKALLPHEEAVKRIQSLMLLHNKKRSAVFLSIVEAVFYCIYILPFSSAGNACVVLGLISLISVVYNNFPKVNLFLSFEIPKIDEGEPNRIRSIQEISAYLTTCLSFCIRLVELAFKSLADNNLFYIVITICSIGMLFTFVFILGDFWFVWLMFHLIFVLPGFMLQRNVQSWINSQDNEERNPVIAVPPDGTTLVGEDDLEEQEEVEKDKTE